MCWCIGKAASQTEEFYMLPEDDKMIVYDGIAVSTVVDLGGGGISTCDIPFCDDMGQFSREYLRLTKMCIRDSPMAALSAMPEGVRDDCRAVV